MFIMILFFRLVVFVGLGLDNSRSRSISSNKLGWVRFKKSLS